MRLEDSVSKWTAALGGVRRWGCFQELQFVPEPLLKIKQLWQSRRRSGCVRQSHILDELFWVCEDAYEITSLLATTCLSEKTKPIQEFNIPEKVEAVSGFLPVLPSKFMMQTHF